MSVPPFILASASPARRKLLQMVGIYPIVHQSNFDESQIKLTNSVQLVETLAQKKASIVAASYHQALVLGCDSILEFDGKIYGKPESLDIAMSRWQEMRGRQGNLYTGHALIDTTQQKELVYFGVTKVYFSSIDDDTIEAYIKTGEPLKCAGNFAIEGKGGLFIEKIEGCHSNVIGLSLPLLHQMLSQLGYKVTDFW